MVYLSRFKESRVILIPLNLFASNPAQHITHLRQRAYLVRIQEVPADEAVEPHMVASLASLANLVRGAIEISSAIWKTVRSKKASWDKLNGIEHFSCSLAPTASRLRGSDPTQASLDTSDCLLSGFLML